MIHRISTDFDNYVFLEIMLTRNASCTYESSFRMLSRRLKNMIEKKTQKVEIPDSTPTPRCALPLWAMIIGRLSVPHTLSLSSSPLESTQNKRARSNKKFMDNAERSVRKRANKLFKVLRHYSSFKFLVASCRDLKNMKKARIQI